MKLSKSEIDRKEPFCASTRHYTTAIRKQADGRYKSSLVVVETGEVLFESKPVKTKFEVVIALNELLRMFNKICNDKMSEASRDRNFCNRNHNKESL